MIIIYPSIFCHLSGKQGWESKQRSPDLPLLCHLQYVHLFFLNMSPEIFEITYFLNVFFEAVTTTPDKI